MKKLTVLILTTVMFFFAGCGDSGKKTEKSAENHGGKEHKKTESHGKSGHHSGGHMGHMNDVKKWLKTELGDKYDQVIPEATEKQLLVGKKIYSTTCASCHGKTGKGDGPGSVSLKKKPADFTDPSHSKFYSDMGRIHIIKNGVKETAMIAWGKVYNEEQIQSIYAYVRSLRNTEEVVAGSGKFVCPMHSEITSEKEGKCSKCGMTLIPNKKKAGHHKDGGGHAH